jgi:hypothetical protein
MRLDIRMLRRLTFVVALIAVATMHDALHKAGADAPGVSFSVDLDASAAGIQSTRSMPVGTPFSIAVWLDNVTTPPGDFVETALTFTYDDARFIPSARPSTRPRPSQARTGSAPHDSSSRVTRRLIRSMSPSPTRVRCGSSSFDAMPPAPVRS